MIFVFKTLTNSFVLFFQGRVLTDRAQRIHQRYHFISRYHRALTPYLRETNGAQH